jgi:hypothetical protein
MRDIERIVGTVFEEISAALARGDRVENRQRTARAPEHARLTGHTRLEPTESAPR